MAAQPDAPAMSEAIAIDPALVERYVIELGRFGAYGESGVWRVVYSPEWTGATRQYAAWCRDGGLAVRSDAVGNVWGRLEGSAPGPAVVTGSHIDSQRPGGRYDGALGALAGLIALRALWEQFGMPRRTLETVAFCEEEGSRFPAAAWWGSRAISGRIAPADPDRIVSLSRRGNHRRGDARGGSRPGPHSAGAAQRHRQLH